MRNLEELEKMRESVLEEIGINRKSDNIRIVVGMATCGIAAGAKPVIDAIIDEISKNNIRNVKVVMTGCIGICRLEPIVEVYSGNGDRVTYVRMTDDKARQVVTEHIIKGKPCFQYTIGAVENGNSADAEAESQPVDAADGQNHSGKMSIVESTFFKKQVRLALKNCGIINPESIDEYVAYDGYKALWEVLTSMSPQDVIDTIKKSGLRGRGGGGFSTGLKWELASKSEDNQKYVCCNADEGDPGAFMDRSILEGDPHSILEAMAIAGYAIGSNQGYIYVRAEYPTAVKRLDIAIKQAKQHGLLGKNIFGTGFDFDIELRLGAGAFVCGEETALMTSIEGKRGEPRPRPPFPSTKGLWQKPTILNNVETYANIAQIFLKGAEWFSSIGTEKSKGTKVFAVGGKINTTGLIEVPMGTTLGEIIYDICGGIPNGKKFKVAQIGGPSGGCIPASLIDTPIDYDSLTQVGAMMGSGGLIIMDEDACMVDIAKFFLEFTVDESCGKCPPCRIGTKRMLEILQKIIHGDGELQDIEKLRVLAKNIKISALCGLGQTAPNPIISTLRYFEDEYTAHVKDKKCIAGVCKSMSRYIIESDACRSCGICAKNCPVSAISGEKGIPYVIDSDKCTRCGTCIEKCPFKAIYKNY